IAHDVRRRGAIEVVPPVATPEQRVAFAAEQKVADEGAVVIEDEVRPAAVGSNVGAARLRRLRQRSAEITESRDREVAPLRREAKVALALHLTRKGEARRETADVVEHGAPQ